MGPWYAVRKSVQLNAREFDYLGPLLGLVRDEPAEIGGRAGKHCSAQVGEPRLHPGVGESGVDLLVELLDDLGWRAPGRAEAVPPGGLVAWHEIPHGWDIRQFRRSRRAGHCEGAQLARPDVLDRRCQRAEYHLHLSADEIGQRGRVAAIRHME